QHQAGPIPGDDFNTIGAFAPKHEDHPREWILAERLAHQRRKPFAALPEVDRPGGYEHTHARGDRDHAAAVTARKTSCKVASSVPGGTRTVAAPIMISIADELPEWLGAIGTAARDRDLCKTTDAKVIRLSPVRARCASRRQVNNCCGVSPCRRATALTVSPGSYVSATISAFCSGGQPRRRPVPVNTSTRRTGSGSLTPLGLSKSSVSDMCPSPLESGQDIRRSAHRREGGAEEPLTP